MRIPSSNLFNLATKMIGTQQIKYIKYKNRSLDKQRQWVSHYEEPIFIPASIQAIPRDRYVELGLALQEIYIKIFASIDILDLERGVSGDRFEVGNKKYVMQSDTDWFVQDGWASCIAVQVKQSFPSNG